MQENEVFSQSIEGRSISVETKDGQVTSARYDGVAGELETAIFRAVCEAMVGHSLREASEHSAFYALHKLVNAGVLMADREGRGILLPNNIHPDLARAQQVIRKIHQGSPSFESEGKEWNFEDRGLSQAWINSTKLEKKERIGSHVASFLALNKLEPNLIVRFDIDKYDRIEMQLSESIDVNDKPKLLMGLERYLRTQTKERLEVFAFEMKDLNRIRRL